MNPDAAERLIEAMVLCSVNQELAARALVNLHGAVTLALLANGVFLFAVAMYLALSRRRERPRATWR